VGRPQTFDHDTVVRAARDVFWQVGYEGASLSELESATGLKRSSLYHAFGSKRGLFDAAVEHYLDQVVRPRLTGLHPDAAPDALLDYLRGLRSAILDDPLRGTRGCLLIGVAGAAIGTDPAVAEVVTRYRAELRTAIGHGVDARMPGHTPADRHRLAEVCTGLVVAALALARTDPVGSADQLDVAADLIGTELP